MQVLQEQKPVERRLDLENLKAGECPGLIRGSYKEYFDVVLKFHDMDIYGHLNNVIYSQFVDNSVHNYLYREAGFNMRTGENIGLMVNSSSDFFEETRWPEVQGLNVGIRVNRLGSSSVEYAGAVFAPAADNALAQARYTHVWVDRKSRKPAPIPAEIRAAMERILIG